ncbi:DUF4440 domain-containing protein [Rhodococcus sp. D2-41]|nr:DUF4440 domain-containing protein [Rhodococcus sp. D2-41]
MPRTDPALAEVLEELRRREPIFHRPESGTTRADFEAMTAHDFWEVGASGQRYDREYVRSVLDARDRDAEDPWQTSDFRCARLGPDVYLLTYTLVQGPRVTRRSTVWERRDDRWVIRYHQGTLVGSGPGPEPPV